MFELYICLGSQNFSNVLQKRNVIFKKWVIRAKSLESSVLELSVVSLITRESIFRQSADSLVIWSELFNFW